jgi:tetratricopeptide (TPR) repeat protein
MIRANVQSFTRRPSFILTALTLLAIFCFLAVSRLVARYGEQEKALARHMYALGHSEQASGRPERALEAYRAALLYDRDNFQYQLSLARALRDSGRTDEAETYLLRLWEANPQDGAVNLALGRLAARRGSVEGALHYYHNAIYGIWPANTEDARNNAEFELIEFLIKAGANPQAQAELITLAARHPFDKDVSMQIAQLFMQVHDYDHSLKTFQSVLDRDHGDAAAAAGAGESAFALSRYRNAESYLRSALNLNPNDTHSSDLLQMTNVVLAADPFVRGLTEAESMRRMRTAYEYAGARLEGCAKEQGIDLTQQDVQTSPLVALHSRWLAMKPEMKRPNLSSELGDASGSPLDLVADIEQETAKSCGEPSGMDKALLLITQERSVSEMGAGK